MIKTLYFLLCVLLCSRVDGQQYKFQISAITSDNQTTQPLPFFVFYINSVPFKTMQSGEVIFLRDPSVREVNISITDPNYVMISPAVVGFPVDTISVTTIIVHARTQTEKAASLYLKEFRKAKEALSGQIARSDSSDISLQKKMDSLLKVVSISYKVNELDLKSATEILNGRERYFNEISHVMKAYIVEAWDVYTVFKQLSGAQIDSLSTYRQLDSTIKNYNQVFLEYNNNSAEYEKAIATYWNSPELREGFNYIFTLTSHAHFRMIYKANDSVNAMLTLRIHERSAKKRRVYADNIVHYLSQLTTDLNGELVYLELQTNKWIDRLNARREIISN